MRTEAEIREALELCQQSDPPSAIGIQTRDATVEALRFCLGIDNADTSPMQFTLVELLEDLRADQGQSTTVTE